MVHLTLQLGGSAVVPFGRHRPGGFSEQMGADMRPSIIATLIAASVLTACTGVTPVPTTVVTGGMPNPEVALQQSMQHVDAEMTELGTMRAQPIQTADSVTPVVPDDLQRIVNFTWSGSLDAGVAKLAQSIGYTFFTTAPPHAPPLSVAVQVQGVRALDAFQALGEEAGAAATVEVDPLHHQVKVIHHA
jgi:defect-in-organelle-trafficking protein DotD